MGNASCCVGSELPASKSISAKNNFEPTQSQLRKAVENLFRKYDTDNSGYLEKAEVEKIIRAALEQLEGTRETRMEEVNRLIEKGDQNKDGRISKDELLSLFQKVAKF